MFRLAYSVVALNSKLGEYRHFLVVFDKNYSRV